VATLLDTFFTRLGFEVDEPALQSAQTKIAGLGKSLLGLGIFSTLSVAGIWKLTQSTTAALATVQSMSDRTGIATEAIAGMTKAAAAFDVSAEGTRGTLETLNNTIGGVATGMNKRMVTVFQTLGLSARDASGQIKDTTTFLGDVAQKIQTMPVQSQQAILNRLGIDPNMIGLLRNGREEFERLYETARAGIPFRASDYERAAELEKGFRRVKSAITEVGQTVALALMPAIQQMIDRFMLWWNTSGRNMLIEFRQKIAGWGEAISKIYNNFRQLTGGADGLTRAVKAIAAIIAILLAMKLVTWVVEAAKGVQVLAKAFSSLALKTGLTLIQFLLIVAAIAAVGIAIYLLVDDFMVWRRGGESVIGNFEKRFPELFNIIRKGVATLRDAFKQMWESLKELWVQVSPLLAFLGKKLLIVAAVITGIVIAAVLLLLYITVLALTKIITWITKLSTWFAKMIPIETLERYWKQFVTNLLKSFDEIREGWQSMTSQLKEIWQATSTTVKQIWTWLTTSIKAIWDGITNVIAVAWNWLVEQWREELERFRAGWDTLSDGIKAIWEGLKTLWQGALDGFVGGWQNMADKIRSIWDSLMGWLKPWLDRIETFFNFVSDKAGGLANKVAGLMPAPAAAAPSRMELAGLGGIMPPVVPTNTISNANASTVNQTDVKATINVQGAANPEATGAAVAAHVDKLAQVATRNAQGSHG
jgi:hypothetical protein